MEESGRALLALNGGKVAVIGKLFVEMVPRRFKEASGWIDGCFYLRVIYPALSIAREDGGGGEAVFVAEGAVS